MPFRFSLAQLPTAQPSDLLIDDRRNNPVRGRDTKFRLLQANMLAYTFVDGIPGFSTPGINSLPFDQIVAQPTLNAAAEGQERFAGDFLLTGSQRAKVDGDVFEVLEGAIHWNVAAAWNSLMRGFGWNTPSRLPKPSVKAQSNRQVAALSLPRGYDWVRLLTPAATLVVTDLRSEIAAHGLALPTSTPDLVIVDVPAELESDVRFATALPDLSHTSQRILQRAYLDFEGLVHPAGFVLAIALKKSLRSDRLYQPLYEANIMQLLLEAKLGAPRVDFEVHTLDDAGTGAQATYGAASLAGIARGDVAPHRAVRDLYKPASAADLSRRFLDFVVFRTASFPPSP